MDKKSIIALASPFITTFLGFMLAKIFQNKAKLIAYYGYISEHKIRLPKEESSEMKEILIYTHAIEIRNVGSLPAKNVKISHSILPNYHITQNIEYKVSDLPGGGKEILFPALIPKEFVTISYLYYPPLTYREIKTSIKSDEGFAKIIDVIPTATLSAWQRRSLFVLLFVGCSTIVYWAGVLFFYLINITL